MKRCPHCGTRNDKKAIICKECQCEMADLELSDVGRQQVPALSKKKSKSAPKSRSMHPFSVFLAVTCSWFILPLFTDNEDILAAILIGSSIFLIIYGSIAAIKDQENKRSSIDKKEEKTGTNENSSIPSISSDDINRVAGKALRGMFAVVSALFSVGGMLDTKEAKRDTGHCDGNCSACPDHYGYRYGRWYYGKGHQHSCERGGNGGQHGEGI